MLMRAECGWVTDDILCQFCLVFVAAVAVCLRVFRLLGNILLNI